MFQFVLRYLGRDEICPLGGLGQVICMHVLVVCKIAWVRFVGDMTSSPV